MCEDCKYCTELKGCFCYCKKKYGRMNIFDHADCKHFVEVKQNG